MQLEGNESGSLQAMIVGYFFLFMLFCTFQMFMYDFL